MGSRTFVGFVTWFLVAGLGDSARADRFELSNGGLLRGQSLHHQDASRQGASRDDYLVRTEHGGLIELTRDQVRQHHIESEAERAYFRKAAQSEDTVQQHWELAEFCREHRLDQHHRYHLKQVIAREPNHGPARRGLGYSQIQGRWQKRDEFMEEQGYVWFQNRWMTRQEQYLIEKRQEEMQVDARWKRHLTLLRARLHSRDAHRARRAIRETTDPAAVGALAEMLASESDRNVRLLYVRTLAGIGTESALSVLVVHTFYERDAEVLYTCLDKMLQLDTDYALQRYVSQLEGNDPHRIRVAALALEHFGDPAAIDPLIQALVTPASKSAPEPPTLIVDRSNRRPAGEWLYEQRRQQVELESAKRKRRAEQMQTFLAGSSTPTSAEPAGNRHVLAALVKLSGGRDFGYDQRAWRAWRAVHRRSESVSQVTGGR